MSYNLWPHTSFDRDYVIDPEGMNPDDWRKLYLCEPAPSPVAWVIPHGSELDGCEVYYSPTRRDDVYLVSGVRGPHYHRVRVKTEYLTTQPWWNIEPMGGR